MGFAEYIVYLFNFGLAMSAVLALIMLIAAGIKLIQSRGNPGQISEAKQQMVNCFIGLAVLLTSYILLTTINPNIINISNISLNGGQTSSTTTTTTEDGEVIKNYTFEEIPLGTIVEGILAGNSSEKNALPCYEYETKEKDDEGRIIIGDTIDQNKDGAINEKDVLLNKDILYCMSLLNKGIKNKTEVHLKTLINELNGLLQSNCSCTNCYKGPLIYEPSYDCATVTVVPCVPYEGNDCSNYNPKPSKCESCDYNCGCCGVYEKGCKLASYSEETQKAYSSCRNTDQINCKRQEIKQLVDGRTPDEICYKEGWIKGMDSDEFKETRLTFSKAVQRLAYFKQYYIDEVDELKKAELKMKEPYGERISMAELYNNVQTRKSTSVSITNFDGYDISRYCRKPNCVEYDGDTCVKYGFNTKNRICQMDEKAEATEACKKSEGAAEDELCKEYYTYSGDGATFYFSDNYNNDVADEIKVMDSADSKCDIEEQSAEKEMYGGLIPIGEVVDDTEAWGTEAARLIETLIGETKKIGDTAVIISDFPPTWCNCSNCTQSIPIECCTCACSGEDCCPSVSCQGGQCSTCEPSARYINNSGNTITIPYLSGCYTCGKKRTPITKYKAKSKEQYYVCDFTKMCDEVRKIYQIGPISNTCFLPSANDDEENRKEKQREKIGYLKRFEIRESLLYSLSGIDINTGTYSAGAAALFPELDCLTGFYEVKVTDTLNCDSTAQNSIPNRITLINKLETSREKLTGCVKGYSYPNKETAENARIMSCYEGVNSKVVILPEFPYPNKSSEKYINCYPYNSGNLNVDQKQICFYNINRTGTATNPGCLIITKEYMDNYYCCQ